MCCRRWTVQGVSQLLAGLLSDKIGRKWPTTVGLLLAAAGLLVVAFGMGFDGSLQPGDISVKELMELQFGHLVIAACLMG